MEMESERVNSSERAGGPGKGERNDDEFESFLADIQPALETSVGRLGVAGALDNRSHTIDSSRLVLTWPDAASRIVEELR